MNTRTKLAAVYRVVTPMTLAWALALLLLPPMACSGTAATGSSGAELTAAAQGDLVARLPAEVTTIGYIDFAALRNSPVYEYAKREGSALADPEDLEEIIAETGIDPHTDLHRLAFASAGSMVNTDPDSSGMILVATFDRERILDSFGDQGSDEYGGFTLYEIVGWSRGDRDDDDAEDGEDDADDEQHGYLTILDDNTLAFGGEESIRAIIDVAGGAPSARTNDRLMGLLEDVDPDSEIWMVTAQDSMLGDMQAPEGTPMPQIPVDRINALIVSARLTDGLALQIRGRTEQQEDAKLLGDSINGMLAFGKMMLQSNSPEIFEILDRAVSAGSSGRDVTIRANLSMHDIEALSAFAKSQIDKDGTEA